MKTRLIPLLAACAAGIALNTGAQETPPGPAAAAQETRPATPPAGTDNPATAEPADLRLNFRNAPLDLVLNYLSEAAGFIIVLETPVRGTVDVWSNQPVSRQEAVELLDSALARNGYAAIRDGRKLTVVSQEAAKTRNIPIVQSADWETIPQSDVVATYIIPVRYINATQLITTLQPLTPEKMQITANADSNSLLITDSQAAIRRIAQIASLLDSSVSAVSTMKIIPLKHADAAEMAATITSLYANQNRNSRGNVQQGGRGNFPGGGGRGNN
jgi:general secretion pathway protein D